MSLLVLPFINFLLILHSISPQLNSSLMRSALLSIAAQTHASIVPRLSYTSLVAHRCLRQRPHPQLHRPDPHHRRHSQHPQPQPHPHPHSARAVSLSLVVPSYSVVYRIVTIVWMCWIIVPVAAASTC